MSELYHHGIVGQKWGTRHGPPYPLDGDKSLRISRSSKPSSGYKPNTPDMHNREQSKYEKEIEKIPKEVIKKWSKSDIKNYCKYRESGITKEYSINIIKQDQKTRKAIIIGSAVVAAAIVGYIAYKKIDSGEVNELVERGKMWLKGSDVTFDNAFHKLNVKDKVDTDVDSIFHNFADKINPDYGKPGTTNNCRRCTFAYEIRRRGYDVMATKTHDGTGQTSIGILSALDTDKNYSPFIAFTKKGQDLIRDTFADYSGQGKDELLPTSVNDIFDKYGVFRRYPNGSRGELAVTWKPGGAHSMAWEIIDNKPVIFDCQTHKKYTNAEEFFEIYKYVRNMYATRLDNLTLDPKFLLRWVQNA